MSREIKFRAWHKKGCAYIAWDLIRFLMVGKSIMVPIRRLTPEDTMWDEICCHTQNPCDPFQYPGLVMEQFTGLKDRNGKEIYEGDIVSFHYFYGSVGPSLGFVEAEHELRGVVKFREFGWAVSAISGEHWRGYTGYSDGEGESSVLDLYTMSDGSIHEESFEILGTIHENPELLTK
jgi:uncharacterized phage protein (TIGR01671 family)